MLRLSGISAAYDGDPVVIDIDLEVGSEIVALLGPSGSGKSTLLRVIAGLHRPSTGQVTWDGQDLTATPAHERRFGLMFQDFALFPHLNVAQNVGFGPRMRRAAGSERDAIVERTLETLGLTALAERGIEELSGGQQQRVALARALASEPRLLLLDEPLGSLDRGLRDQVLQDLVMGIEDAGLPAIVVTHDVEEAFAMADRVALLDAGELVRVGTPQEVWEQPGSATAAALLGDHTILDVVSADGTVATPLGRFELDAPDGPAVMIVTPDAVHQAPDGVVARVVRDVYHGTHHLVRLAVGDVELTMISETEVAGEITVAIDAGGVSLG